MARFLMVTATSGANRELADVFASTATAKGHDADVVDFTFEQKDGWNYQHF